MEVIVVRHGDYVHGAGFDFLTNGGEQVAAELALLADPKRNIRLVTSPAGRTMNTLQPLAEAVGVESYVGINHESKAEPADHEEIKPFLTSLLNGSRGLDTETGLVVVCGHVGTVEGARHWLEEQLRRSIGDETHFHNGHGYRMEFTDGVVTMAKPFASADLTVGRPKVVARRGL